MRSKPLLKRRRWKNIAGLPLVGSLFFLSIFCGMGIGVKGQEAPPAGWTRFETSNKEISFTLPPGYLVDANEDKNGLHIVGYYEGASIDFRMSKDPDALERLLIPDLNNKDSVTFEIDKVLGLRTMTSGPNGKTTEALYLASDTHFYHLEVTGAARAKPVAVRVLYSVLVNGKTPYDRPEKVAGEAMASRDVVLLDTARSSTVVAEAYGRKYKKRDIRITFAPMSEYKEEPEPANGMQPPFILERPVIELKLSRRPFVFSRTMDLTARLKANFMANGEIGDITVYSWAMQEFGAACAESLRRARFIPATVNGKPVDMVFTDECKAISSSR